MNASLFCSNRIAAVSRRDALKTVSAGFGYLAFAGLASSQAAENGSLLAAKSPHFEPRAKRVIFLCMRGGPSHVDTFDDKPRLRQDHGRPSHYGTPWCASHWKFQQHGASGLSIDPAP
jgi:anaerobic selenocysteine-containing dehydrogenase